MIKEFENKLNECPIVAILRGIKHTQAIEVATNLVNAGISIMEVPVNSPDPFVSIKKMVDTFGDQIICGSGTVLTKEDVKNTANAGGKIVVMPNTNAEIIKYCLKYNVIPIPGFATPTEAMIAIQSGAQYLKLFPAGTYGLGHIQALKAVIPAHIKIIAVGGIGIDNINTWLNNSAIGVGIGSCLFKPEFSTNKIFSLAQQFIKTLKV